MTAVLAALRRRFRSETRDVILECRHCGTAVDRGTECCPVCEASEIARYEIL